jgi:AAA domain
MLKSYEIINQLSTLLSSYQSEEKIADYKIMLNMSMIIDVYIRLLSGEEVLFEELDKGFKQKYKNINFHFVTPEQIEYEENDYANLFDNRTPVINYGFRKRFDGFFDIKPIQLKETTSCPVVTFYSYKGGMGRTTTLVAYALHCAINLNKKVVILDCDFEAPGYLNFFNIHEKDNKNGVVEYLLDKKFDKNIQVTNYCYTLEELAEKLKLPKLQNLRIMPAGDLAQSAEVNYYVEALAKLDYTKTTLIVKDFNNLLLSIEKELQPDIILIDSRTGFSDVFDFTALKLSDLIVSFFGSSEQTRPGRKFLLEKYVQIKKDVRDDLGTI